MKIKRTSTGFAIVTSENFQKKEKVLANVNTFEQAREFMAENGSKDAAKPIASHTKGVCTATLEAFEVNASESFAKRGRR